MEVIDEKGRVFGVVNVIDLLVVFFLLAVVAAGVALVMTDSGTDSESGTESVTLTVQAEEVQPYVAEAIPAPGAIDSGNVTRVENRSVRPATVITENASGAVLVRDHPRLKTVELTVTVEAQNRSGDLYFGRHRLRVGTTVGLDLGTVLLSGQVTAIETDATTQ